MSTFIDALASVAAALIPQPVKDAVNKFLDVVDSALKGETVLVIGNGAAVVIYLVAKFAGSIPDVAFEQAISQAGVGLVLLNTGLVAIRAFVFSPKTVAAIVTTPPSALGPVKAAIESGIPVETVVAAAESQSVG